VTIDASPVPGNLRATIAKAQRIVAAALAPKHPSGRDETVAGAAEAQSAPVAATGRTRPGSLIDLVG
jgi:hypothetical protein